MRYYWRFLDTGANSPYFNMALDEALLLCSQNTRYPILRFFGWSSKTISIGYFQNAERSLNLDYCVKNGIRIVRRITGGRGVYHDKELTYSIIIPRGSIFFKNNNLELYKEISRGILCGLGKIGIHGNLGKPDRRGFQYRDKSNCFNALSFYEISVGGRKILGSAQKWDDAGVLQQGSLLLDLDGAVSDLIFDKRLDMTDGSSNKKSGITTVKESLGHVPPRHEIVEAIKNGFEEFLDIGFISSEVRTEELAKTKFLLENKYSCDAWNFHRQAESKSEGL